MRRMLDPLRAQFFPQGLPVGTRHYLQGPVLDQGSTGTCVAHGWAGWSYGAPLMTKPTAFPKPFDLYRSIVKVDEWEDNDHEASAADNDLQLGTSVRAGAKVLQARGHIQQYLWAESVEDVRSWHLANFGGVVLGVNWTSAMFKTDADGFIRYTGSLEGGHCIKTTGWSDDKKASFSPSRGAVRILNSWGRTWGESGRAWITRDDLERLIADQGEACAAIERKLQTT